VPVYATAADYAAYTGQSAPADADRLLARAAEVITQAMKTGLYAVDSGGVPTAATIRAALRDATCAQVAYWTLTGDEQGTSGEWDQVQIGSVRLARGGNPRQPTTGGGVSRLAPHAYTLLTNAGVLPGVVITSWSPYPVG